MDLKGKQESITLNYAQIKGGYFCYWIQRCGQPWMYHFLSQGTICLLQIKLIQVEQI